MLNVLTGSLSIFFILSDSLGGTLTGDFPQTTLEAEEERTGTLFFLCPVPSTISTLLAELLPGLAVEAFVGVCCCVPDCEDGFDSDRWANCLWDSVPVCVVFAGGAFGHSGLADFNQVTSVWTEQDTICFAATDAY